MSALWRTFRARRRTCRSRRNDALLGALLLFLLQPLAASAEEGLGHSLNPLPEPLEAPELTLQDMDENAVSLSDFRGKVVLINFWATWCPPCRKEMPSMERVYRNLKDKGFVVLAVNQWEDPDHVFAYTGQLSVDPTFPILFDRDSKIAEAYQVRGLPTSYLIDPAGMIRYRAIGGREFDHPEVEALILELMQ